MLILLFKYKHNSSLLYQILSDCSIKEDLDLSEQYKERVIPQVQKDSLIQHIRIWKKTKLPLVVVAQGLKVMTSSFSKGNIIQLPQRFLSERVLPVFVSLS